MTQETSAIFTTRGFVLKNKRVDNLPGGGQSLDFSFEKSNPNLILLFFLFLQHSSIEEDFP